MIAIGVGERVTELEERLRREFEMLRSEGVEVRMKTVRRGDLTFVGCDPISRKTLNVDVSRRFRFLIANALADLIVDSWEDLYLNRVIRSHYGYLDHEERDVIRDYAAHALRSIEGDSRSVPGRVQRKGRVLSRLAEYLDRNSELVLDGFVTFRLKDYMEEMEEAVDVAVEEVIMEKEQQEFIKILRYFLESRETRRERVDILLGAEDDFQLLDGGEEPTLEDLPSRDGSVPMDQEEAVISALLALAPRTVTVHRADRAPDPLIDTLKEIFGGRLSTCGGCHVCLADAGSRPGRELPRESG